MSNDRLHGSAVGIPEPPGPPTFDASNGAAPHGTARTTPVARRPRRRWLLWLLVLPIAAIATILANRDSDSSSSAIDRLEVGDCFEAPASDLFAGSNIDEVGCDQPHNHEVYAIGTTTTPIDSGIDAENNPEIVRICRTEVAPGVLAALARTAGVTPGVIVNRNESGRLVCTANTSERTGSLIDGRLQRLHEMTPRGGLRRTGRG
jgi:hypothetical protein